VCVNDVSANQEGIDKLVKDLNSTHGEGSAIGYAADVTKSSEVEKMIEESVQKLGPLTIMIANAGIAKVKPILEVSDEDARQIFDVNYFGVWNCYTRAAKQMIKQGPVQGPTGYKIIGCASIVAFKPFPILTDYSASKWAVRGLTQGFAMEMSKHKIQVNAYAPGIVGTAMWELIDQKLGELEGRPIGETVKKYSQELTAMGRVSTPEDVAKVVGGFLCGSDSDFVTGQTIVVRFREFIFWTYILISLSGRWRYYLYVDDLPHWRRGVATVSYSLDNAKSEARLPSLWSATQHLRKIAELDIVLLVQPFLRIRP